MMEIWRFGDCIDDPKLARAFESLVQHLCYGREGHPWCPWAVRALEENRFWCGDARSLGPERFEIIVDAIANTFETCFPIPISGNRAVGAELNSLTILLRDDTEYDDAEVVVQGKRADLLARGMMVGLLHPRSMHRALSLGPPGVPYRTPDPFLTIRWAVPDDILFVGVNPKLRMLLDNWIRRCESHMEDE